MLSLSCLIHFSRERWQQAEIEVRRSSIVASVSLEFLSSVWCLHVLMTHLWVTCLRMMSCMESAWHGKYSSQRLVMLAGSTCDVDLYIPYMDFINSTRLRQGGTVALLFLLTKQPKYILSYISLEISYCCIRQLKVAHETVRKWKAAWVRAQRFPQARLRGHRRGNEGTQHCRKNRRSRYVFKKPVSSIAKLNASLVLVQWEVCNGRVSIAAWLCHQRDAAAFPSQCSPISLSAGYCSA